MVAYVSYIGAGVSTPTSEQLIALLNSDKTNPYVAQILGNYTFEQYCVGFLAGTGSIQPGVSNKTAIDSLIAGALAGYGLTSESDLSNIVGKAGSASAILGAMNKAFSPGAFAGGVGCEAGDEGYPGDTVCAFAYGNNVKTKAICAIGVGKDLENLGDYSSMFGKGNPEYKLEGSDDDKGNQSLYLYYLKLAGGTVTGTGDSRVGITGVNKGLNSILAGNSNWNGADNSAVFGNQNIIGEDRDDNPCYSNLIGNGMINFINSSSHCGILGAFCKILNSHTTHLFGHALLADGRYGKTVVGVFNDDKANTQFEVGNGTSEADRKNAFEVLKDGRAKVQSAPVESDDVVRKKELDAISVGGGGGKLYIHRIKLHNSGGPSNHYVSFYVYSSTETHFAIENLYRYFDNNYATLIDENDKIYIGSVSFTAYYFSFRGTIVTGPRGSLPSSWESKDLIDMPLSNVSISSYTVIEL